MQKQIIVTVSPTGEITIETTGYKGNACEKATAELEKALGMVKGKKKKPDYHVKDLSAVQKVGGA